jgi:hypothetical protein
MRSDVAGRGGDSDRHGDLLSIRMRTSGLLSQPRWPPKSSCSPLRSRPLLDELERRSGVLPFKSNDRTGSRGYCPGSADAGVDGFDPLLDAIDPSRGSP